MNQILVICLAGAAGALSRYGIVSAMPAKFFPWGTLSVNVLGSFLMGLAYVFIVERALVSPELKPIVMTGFLGAFTTFSAFSLEAWQLYERSEPLLALAYIAASVVFCIVALIIGVGAARYLL